MKSVEKRISAGGMKRISAGISNTIVSEIVREHEAAQAAFQTAVEHGS